MSLLKYLLAIFLLTIYIYGINFTFLPITASQVLDILGVPLFLVTRRSNILGTKPYTRLFMFAVCIFIWGEFVCLINNTDQHIYFMNFIVGTVASFFGAYFVSYYINKLNLSFDNILKLILYTVFFETILTLLMYFVPTVENLVNKIQISQIGNEFFENQWNVKARLYGLGNAVFFGVLSSCSIGMMSGVYTLLYSESKKEYYLHLFMVLVIAITTILVTRFSLFISLIAICTYLYRVSIYNRGRAFNFLVIAAIVVYSVITVAYLIFPDNLIRWVSVMFDLETNLSNDSDIYSWWANTRFSSETLIFGDGMFVNANGVGYYGGMDIGYWREIYYGGLVGLFLSLAYQYKILSFIRIIKPDKDIHIFVIGLFLCLLASLAKGDISFIDIFFLLLVLCDFSNSTSTRSNSSL